MVLFLHILIASAGVAIASILLLSPKASLLLASKILGAITLLSGIYLILVSDASLVKTCLVGIAYYSFTIFATLIASSKLKGTL